MKIVFTEDIDLALRKSLEGRATLRRRIKCGESQEAEFLGEDSDAETIDLRLEDGMFALRVPRFAVAIKK